MSCTTPKLRRQPGETDPIACFTLHPDGKTLFAATTGSIKVWNIDLQHSPTSIPCDAEIRKLAVDPGGQRLYATLGSSIRAWDLATGADSCHPNPSQGAATVAFTAAGAARVLTVWGDNCALLDVSTGALLRNLRGGSEHPRMAALSSRADRVLAVDTAGTLRVWDAETGVCLGAWPRASYSEAADRLLAVAFHPDGRRVLSSTFADTILWDTERGERQWHTTGPSPHLDTAIFHPDGRRAIMFGHNDVLEIWDIAAGRRVRSFPAARGDDFLAVLCPDGRRLVYRDNDPRHWRALDIETGAEVMAMQRHTSPICALVPHPDGLRLLSAGEAEPIVVWELETGAPAAMLGNSPARGALDGAPVAPAEKRIDELLVMLETMRSYYRGTKDMYADSAYSEYPWAKDNLRWTVAYQMEVEAIEISPDETLVNVLDRLEVLAGEMGRHDDHAPTQVRQALEDFRQRENL